MLLPVLLLLLNWGAKDRLQLAQTPKDAAAVVRLQVWQLLRQQL
jgi:hypothetical protein